MPGDFPAAANASGSREAGQPGDGIHCDDGERHAGLSLGPGRVATAASKGRGAAAAGEQWSWVCKIVVTTQGRHTPVFPAKQAERVMESTVTTV